MDQNLDFRVTSDTMHTSQLKIMTHGGSVTTTNLHYHFKRQRRLKSTKVEK